MKCPWQKEIKIWLTQKANSAKEENHTIKFAECCEEECPYYFGMNGEKICKRVEWTE